MPETITLTEAVVVSTTHNLQAETIVLTETPIVQPVNYATEFVLGDYIPTIALNGPDRKRTFILGGSYLS